MRRLRVLVADDQPAVLETVRRILEPEYEIAGEAQDGLALLAAAEQARPDIIVADITMPQLDGIEAVRRITKANPKIRVVFLTMRTDAVYAAAARKAGGSAFVLKSSAGDDLLPAIHEALRGRRFVSPAIARRPVRRRRAEAPGARTNSKNA